MRAIPELSSGHHVNVRSRDGKLLISLTILRSAIGGGPLLDSVRCAVEYYV